MIPLRDQERIGQRFQRDLKSRVRVDLFTQRKSTLVVPGREECVYCEDVETLLREVASLSERIALAVHDIDADRAAAASFGVSRAPTTVIRGQTNRPLRFVGIPTGGQFVGLIETLLDAARGSVELAPETTRQLRKLRSEVQLQVYVSPSCPYSPAVAYTAFRFGLANPKLKVEVIEASEFPALLQHHAIRAVPTTVINDRVVLRGALDEAALLRAVLQVVESRGGAVDLGRQGPQTPLPEPSSQQGRPLTSSGLILPR